ncbi:MAG: amidohydrolase [Clostridia bacterium]|nr:amidohydrolase [Clostridia bacterium]
MIKDIPAIDIHCHCDAGSLLDRGSSDTYKISIDFLRDEHRQMGVHKTAFAGTFAAVETDRVIEEENERLAKISQTEDWFYQWVVVDPRKPQTYKQAEKLLKSKKTLGIKLHPGLHGYSLVKYGDDIFSFANELNTVVLTHPAEDDKRENVSIASIAGRYENMKLIIAHLANKDHVNAVLAAENVYVDTSGNASTQNNVIEYAVETIGSEKILFGTDTYSCAFQKGRILLSRISQKDKENILRKNAERIFSL